MGAFKPDEVNEAFAAVCPGELTSKYCVYPFPKEYRAKWLSPKQDKFDGKPVFIKADKFDGVKTDYIWCKNGTEGRGYYHVLTKIAWNNLYSRLSSEGDGTCCCMGDSKRADQWDTTRRIVYNRCRSNCPDDDKAAEQAIQHMAGTKLNPVHGLKI